MQTWQLQDAKARLSEVIRQASTKGPQAITVRGHREVIVLSAKDYQKLSSSKSSFLEFVNQSPLKGIHLKTTRNRSRSRDIAL